MLQKPNRTLLSITYKYFLNNRKLLLIIVDRIVLTHIMCIYTKQTEVQS
jgi:hypothetical protein